MNIYTTFNSITQLYYPVLLDSTPQTSCFQETLKMSLQKIHKNSAFVLGLYCFTWKRDFNTLLGGKYEHDPKIFKC